MTGFEQKTDIETADRAEVTYRVLLVDDQPIIYEAVRRMLSAAKEIELHYCSEGTKALRMASEIKPDVILQDLIMPDVDGLMLVKFYRASELTRDIPVVVLSSREEAKTKAEAFSCGANDYLVKLPDQIEMLARLRYHAKTHKTLVERNAAVEELRRISSTDGLTGLKNRRHFDETLDREWKRARRERQPLSLVMLDVDHFKQFNDNYGHQAGDDCLIRVAEAMQSSLHRPTDTAARYGGEEFIAILPNTPGEGALALAEKMRQAISALNIKHEHSSVANHITVSLGVTTTIPTDDAGMEALIKAADTGLYEAKESGRNRTTVATIQLVS